MTTASRAASSVCSDFRSAAGVAAVSVATSPPGTRNKQIRPPIVEAGRSFTETRTVEIRADDSPVQVRILPLILAWLDLALPPQAVGRDARVLPWKRLLRKTARWHSFQQWLACTEH
jgi:hypothetical protein